MGTELDRDTSADRADPDQPRFGSYIGLFYTAAIVGILSFAIFFDTGAGGTFDRLRSGMTPTEVAAIMGSPRSETKSGTHLVQTWHIADGSTFEVRFEQGKLTAKQRLAQPSHSPSQFPVFFAVRRVFQSLFPDGNAQLQVLIGCMICGEIPRRP